MFECSFTISAEVFPLSTRGERSQHFNEIKTYLICLDVGMSICVFLNFFFLGLLILFVPQMTHAFGEGDPIDGRKNLLLFFA